MGRPSGMSARQIAVGSAAGLGWSDAPEGSELRTPSAGLPRARTVPPDSSSPPLRHRVPGPSPVRGCPQGHNSLWLLGPEPAFRLLLLGLLWTSSRSFNLSVFLIHSFIH